MNNKKKVLLYILTICSIFYLIKMFNNRNKYSSTNISELPKSNSKYPTALKQDEVLLSFKNYNITFYKEFTISPVIYFDIISSQELNNNCELKIDINTPYKFLLEKYSDETKMNYYTYLSYQDFDWDKLYELKIKSFDKNGNIKDKEANIEYLKYNRIYQNQYEKFIGKDIYKNIHKYKVAVVFDLANSNLSNNETFNKINLKINNKDNIFEIGKVVLDYTTKNRFSSSGLQSNTLGVWEKEILPNSKGEYIIDDASFTCNNDLKIKGFKVLNKSAEIKDITLITENNRNAIDKKYKNGQVIEFKKGTNIKPIITFYDKNFVDKFLYSVTIYMIIEYEIDGTNYAQMFEALYLTKPQFDQIIAVEHDKIDLLPYYNRYLNLITDYYKGE